MNPTINPDVMADGWREAWGQRGQAGKKRRAAARATDSRLRKSTQNSKLNPKLFLHFLQHSGAEPGAARAASCRTDFGIYMSILGFQVHDVESSASPCVNRRGLQADVDGAPVLSCPVGTGLQGRMTVISMTNCSIGAGPRPDMPHLVVAPRPAPRMHSVAEKNLTS